MSFALGFRPLTPLTAAVLLAGGVAASTAMTGFPGGAGPERLAGLAAVVFVTERLYALAGLAILIAWRAERSRVATIPLALVLFGLARGVIAPAVAPAGATPDDRTEDRIEGIVRGPVVATRRPRDTRDDHHDARRNDAEAQDSSARSNDSASPIGSARSVDWAGFGQEGDGRGTGAVLETATGDPVWVWADEALKPGERVIVTGRLMTPRGHLGIAQPDQAAALRARGARFVLEAEQVEHLVDEAGIVDLTWRWAAATQARWSRAIGDAGGETPASAALQGLTVGDRARVPEELDERWRAAGIYHVLSVSGLHLAAIAGLAYALLRRLIAGSVLGGLMRPAMIAGPLALVLAVTYTLVTGAQIATVRALIVISLVIVAAMLDRPVAFVDTLGVAAIAILVWRPSQVVDPGFQLSFTAALALAIAPGRSETEASTASAGRVGRWVASARGWIRRGLVASIHVTLATAPITAFHFHQLQAGGLVGNLVLGPLLELVALPLALVGIVVDWSVPLMLATRVVDGVDWMAGGLAQVAPVGEVALVSPAAAIIATGVVLVLVARARRTKLDLALVGLLVAAWALGRAPQSDELRVTFLDVGQGDAAIIETPGGEVWLVDAGGTPGVSATTQATTIRRTLAAYGHTKIDIAIVSHPHPDHYLGLRGLGVPIGELWLADEREGDGRGELAQIARQLEQQGTRIVHPPLGRAHSAGDVDLVVHAPRFAVGDAVVEATDPVRSVNDNSLVVEVRYAGRSILFAGDLEAEGEGALRAFGPVDVVKVPHHGSPTSSTEAFVAATRPRLAIISCGVANAYGFPAPAVVERWEAAGADVLRTDRDGAVTVRIEGDGTLTVEKFVSRAVQ
jgi:competence protein ComEC